MFQNEFDRTERFRLNSHNLWCCSAWTMNIGICSQFISVTLATFLDCFLFPFYMSISYVEYILSGNDMKMLSIQNLVAFLLSEKIGQRISWKRSNYGRPRHKCCIYCWAFISITEYTELEHPVFISKYQCFQFFDTVKLQIISCILPISIHRKRVHLHWSNFPKASMKCHRICQF